MRGPPSGLYQRRHPACSDDRGNARAGGPGGDPRAALHGVPRSPGNERCDAPNLRGQYAEVIYKQLMDFQRGARSDAVMGAMVATLSEHDILDLSHYYAGLPRSKDDRLASAPH